ncbi:MAG: hypothetical protein K6G38_02915 [Gammaproteobacteria bacterium]|nr:hypothetical protein [Gammaproteobacteria bacterium]
MADKIDKNEKKDNNVSPSIAPYLVKGLSKQYAASVLRAKIVAAIVGGIAVLFASVFMVSTVVAKDSQMVINADKGEGSISLSETIAGFEESGGTTILYAEGIDRLRDIDGERTVPEDVNDYDGSHNGTDYFAYTFYIKNVGNNYLSLNATMDITLSTKGMINAIRVEVYRTLLYDNNKLYYDKYAAPAADGSDEPFKYNPNEGTCTSFISAEQIMTESYYIPIGGMVKYTLVMYLEGNDAECTDDILGGSFGFTITFEKK